MPKFPYASPQSWQVQIGKIVVPTDLCAVTISGLKTGVKLDKQTGPGRNGGTIRVLGEDFASFAIDLAAWSQAGFDLLFDVCRLAREQLGQPLTVYHPLLTDGAGVSRMIVELVDWPDGKIQRGQLFAKLTCTSWAPPPKKPKNVATTPTFVAKTPDLATESGAIKLPPLPGKPPGPSATTPKP